MANPTSKHTRSRRDKRRANWKVTFPNIVDCSECGEHTLPHRICPSCGFYRGKKMLEIKEKNVV